MARKRGVTKTLRRAENRKNDHNQTGICMKFSQDFPAKEFLGGSLKGRASWEGNLPDVFGERRPDADYF